MIKKINFLILVILMLSFNSLFADDKFKFGISAPLSGILAEYGIAVNNGINLAKEDYQELTNNIQIIVEDSQWDPKTAVATYNNLRVQKEAQLIYNWGNPTSEAVAPLAKNHRFPLLVMSSDSRVNTNNPYVIRTLRSGAELGELLAEYLISKNYHNIGLVMAENSYVQGMYQGIKNKYDQLGYKLDLIDSFNLDEQNFNSTVTKIKNKNYQAIGVFLITGQVNNFYKQLLNQKVSIPTFGADFLGSISEIKLSGPAINGAVFPDLQVTDQFRERYAKKYGNDNHIAFAANAYDVCTLVSKKFSTNNASKLNSEEILTILKEPINIVGAHGEFSYSKDKKFGSAFVGPIILRKIIDGKIEKINFR